ncbi:hypothetical protein O3M35_006658 [Rhynocoris fuscipes]|uniref:Proliferation-associated SNF2-like protein n=1 Tax=Rhynocoris fuscipes TaxID=488301 RepID=A0AAW1DE97_9HEMI
MSKASAMEPEDSCSSKDSGLVLSDSKDETDYSMDKGKDLVAMEEEEVKRLEEEDKKELAKLRRKLEMEQHEKEVKEANFKRLLHLLEKSQFYAKYLEKRVEKSLEEIAKKKNPKRPLEIDEYSEALNTVSKKHKINNSLSGSSKPVHSEENHDAKTEDQKQKLSVSDIDTDIKQPTLLEGCTLRNYQLQGFMWLKLLFETGMNGILADEMGLGKTVQVIALLCHLYEKRVNGPFLVIAPLSTLPNWLIEFQRFAPQIPVIVYHAPLAERQLLRPKIHEKTRILNNTCRALPVLLTSYELPIRDSYLATIKWQYIIVDEGHRLKNYKSLLSRKLRTYHTVNRLLLTGTPLQNNLTELWSLLHFLLPEIFNKLEAFQTWFQVEEIEALTENDQLSSKQDKILTVLQEILAPFLLRREKKDVKLELPRKKEVLVYCPLTDIQYQLYSSTVDKSIARRLVVEERDLIIPDNPDGTRPKRYSKLRDNQKDIIKEQKLEEDETIVAWDGDVQYTFNIKMNNIHVMLRKIVNHPYLVKKPVLPGSNILRIDEKLVSSSGKLTILDELLKRLKQNNHKVLLFSTMTMILDLIEEFVIMRGYNYERLDGGCDLEERKCSIKRYNNDEDIFIFLLSTRAGGLGINLTAADTVVIFDSDWNPQADLQAQDRCHRIGQTKPVVVYRLVTTGTIDERIVTRAAAKRKLERMIIQEGKFKNLPGIKENCKLKDLKSLLLEKQHSMEIHSNGSVLTDQQWNELLDRSDLMD